MIRQGLTETLQLLQIGGRSDIEAASRAFAADPSAENARRLMALKERELQDGPIGGVES